MSTTEHAEARARFKSTQAGPYFTRGILPFELVLDLDVKDPKDQEKQAAIIREHLSKINWTFYELPTGGKGRHIHAFMSVDTLA